jgi:hypothetical protein
LVLLAKDFRNLLQPGRAVRVREECPLESVDMVIGTMEAIIERLS